MRWQARLKAYLPGEVGVLAGPKRRGDALPELGRHWQANRNPGVKLWDVAHTGQTSHALPVDLCRVAICKDGGQVVSDPWEA